MTKLNTADGLRVLTAMMELLDGAEGYVSEHGDEAPYWNPGVVARARALVVRLGGPDPAGGG